MSLLAISADFSATQLITRADGLSGLVAAAGTRARVPFGNTSSRGAFEYVYILNNTGGALVAGTVVSLDDAASASFDYDVVSSAAGESSFRAVGVVQAGGIANLKAGWVCAKGVVSVIVDAGGVAADAILSTPTASGVAGALDNWDVTATTGHPDIGSTVVAQALEARGATIAAQALCKVCFSA